MCSKAKCLFYCWLFYLFVFLSPYFAFCYFISYGQCCLILINEWLWLIDWLILKWSPIIAECLCIYITIQRSSKNSVWRHIMFRTHRLVTGEQNAGLKAIIFNAVCKILKQSTKTGAVVQENVVAQCKYAIRLIVFSSFNRTAFTLSWNDTSQAYNFNTCKYCTPTLLSPLLLSRYQFFLLFYIYCTGI